ncbi:MAG TPA: response regulator [Verrucomicrobiota bacterium]|nr:response regulator [Verrucomicrobiota bacterium]HNT13305.1 response regulator [Verrucomicrobiota bacterium]
MNPTPAIRILVVEDDDEDFFLTSELLKEIRRPKFVIERARNYEEGLRAMVTNAQEVCLMDFRLGGHDGVELLQAARAAGAEAPVVLLTGAGGADADHAAMKAGAADFLIKGEIEAPQLERALRYAIERKRAASAAAFEQARLAAFGMQVGLALTRRAPLPEVMEKCAASMCQYLNVSLAQVLTCAAEQAGFETLASVGTAADELPGLAQSFDVAALKAGRPMWHASLADIAPPAVAAALRQAGIRSGAAYPLLMEEQLIGALAVYAPETLPETILQELGSVANGVALCIQRKRAEAQAERLAAFPRVNPNPILELTNAGGISYANEAAHALLRSLNKKHLLEILPASLHAIVAECMRSGAPHADELVVVAKRTLSWSFLPVPEIRAVHCYGVEITERLNLEAQYRHAQKLESVGQVAAGIAHDYNNILTVIQGYADFALPLAGAEAQVVTSLKQISGAARRAAALTRKLLTFSQKQVMQTRPLDLNAVLADFGKMLPRLLGEDIALEIAPASGLPAIQADAGMMEQVIMNLVVNARDAMAKGGRLTIITSLAEINADYVQRCTDARVGRFVSISFQDTGCGMTPETMARIFEPFFSTKGAERGSGLGLATVLSIVKQHQGWIEVASTPKTGTTFRIFFPALPAPVVEKDHQEDTMLMAREGRETILLVEDEPELRELVATVLRSCNYRVFEARSGVQALEVWQQQQGRIDLLLTDMVMPGGISGSELARQLRARKADLRVIYSSGYSSEIIGCNRHGDHFDFLAKPYRAPQLIMHVRKSLDAPPAPVFETVMLARTPADEPSCLPALALQNSG